MVEIQCQHTIVNGECKSWCRNQVIHVHFTTIRVKSRQVHFFWRHIQGEVDWRNQTFKTESTTGPWYLWLKRLSHRAIKSSSTTQIENANSCANQKPTPSSASAANRDQRRSKAESLEAGCKYAKAIAIHGFPPTDTEIQAKNCPRYHKQKKSDKEERNDGSEAAEYLDSRCERRGSVGAHHCLPRNFCAL